ncbi:MFS transporter [Actinoallomurus sp. CA-150999]|uniref:MFS transporter n=1 Tax=Actinoallomurus sp. CA-150999 TaxID=3239887 RepID=UPI003D926A9B
MENQPRSWPWSVRLAVMSVAAAVAVSVIYLPQPMLVALSGSLAAPVRSVSVIATAVQVGYAVGILFLVPLSERVQPRRQITVQVTALAAALVVTAALPSVATVALGFAVVGLVANIAQLIIPAAGKLAPADRRGTTTAALVGALLCGIFGGRVVASVLVGAIGWRWVLVVFAALVIMTLPFLRVAMRQEVPLSATGSSYGRLLGSTLALVRSSPTLRQSSAMQFFGFATFNSIWTVMALHLTTGPFHWSVLEAGLFGLVGLAAGLVTPLGGRLVDRFGALPVTGAFAGLLLAATALSVVDSRRIWLFGVTTFLITLANQSMQAGNQSRVLVTNPGAAAQANTLFMVFVFLGGSFGAYAGPVAYGRGGMPAVALQGVVLITLALAVWAHAMRYARGHPPRDRDAPATEHTGVLHEPG